MPVAKVSIEGFALSLAHALAPLEDALKPANATAYFADLGVLFPNLQGNSTVTSALNTASGTIGALSSAAQQFSDSAATGDGDLLLAGAMVTALIAGVAGLDTLAGVL